MYPTAFFSSTTNIVPHRQIIPEQQTPFHPDPNSLAHILGKQMNPPQQQQHYSQQSIMMNNNLLGTSRNSSYIPGSQPKTPGKSSDLSIMMMQYNKENYENQMVLQRQSMGPITPGKSLLDTSMNTSLLTTPRSSLRKESLCKTGEKKFLHTPKRATTSQTNNNNNLNVSSQMPMRPKTPISHNKSFNQSTIASSNRSVHSNRTKNTNIQQVQNNKKTFTSHNQNARKTPKSSQKPPTFASCTIGKNRQSKRLNHSNDSTMNGFLTSTTSSSTLVFDECYDDDAVMVVGCDQSEIYQYLNSHLKKGSRDELRQILETYIHDNLSTYISNNNQSVNDTMFLQQQNSNSMDSEEFISQNYYTNGDTSSNGTFNNSMDMFGLSNTFSSHTQPQLQTQLQTQQSFSSYNTNYPNTSNASFNTSAISNPSSYTRYEPSDLIKKLLREQEEQRGCTNNHSALHQQYRRK